MSRVAVAVLLPLILVAGRPAPADAQQLTPVVEGLHPQQLIRIRTRGHALHIGRFAGVGGDTLYLAPGSGTTWIALDAVDALWVRGTAAKTGAIVGGIMGGVATGAFSAWIVSALCETDDCETLEAGLVGGLLGAAGGALTGAVIGTLINKWHRRYP